MISRELSHKHNFNGLKPSVTQVLFFNAYISAYKHIVDGGTYCMALSVAHIWSTDAAVSGELPSNDGSSASLLVVSLYSTLLFCAPYHV